MTSSAKLRSHGRGSWRLLVRIAWRDALIHRGRSVLIVVLIAIPIVGLSAIGTGITSHSPTPQERIRDTLGSNQAKLVAVRSSETPIRQDPVNADSWQPVGIGSSDAQGEPLPPQQLPTSYLPQGTRVLTLRDFAVIANTATGSGSISAVEGEPWDTAFAGRFVLLSGQAPGGPHEIMATPAALARLGKTVGQQVTLTQPRSGTFTIVGTMRDLAEPNSAPRLFAFPAALDGVTVAQDIPNTSFYLPDLAMSWSAVQHLNSHGIAVLSRQVVLHPPTDGTGLTVDTASQGLTSFLVLTPVIGFILFEVALLAGAAFMVGAKQQERSLATLASVGGDRRMLARVVTSSGLVLGLAGGIFGSLIGIAGGWAYLQLTSDGSTTAFPGLHVNPFITVGIILFAVLAGWVSAVIPARRAARVDVVASLRGATRPLRPSRKAPIVGIVIAIGGAAITGGGVVLVAGYAAGNHNILLTQLSVVLLIVGPIALQVAALVIAPSILRAVARALNLVSTSARLASRDAARNASRTVPAVGAIMSTIFVASFLFTYMAAAQASQTAYYEYNTAPGLVSADFFQGSPTTVQTRQLSAVLQTTLHSARTEVLSSAARPGQNPASSDTFPLPQLDPSARCTQLPSGPTPVTPGSLSITSQECQGPRYLTFPTDQLHIWVATPSQISFALGTQLNTASMAALRSGQVVAFYPQYVRNNSVTINWWTAKQRSNFTMPGGPGLPTKTVSIPAVVQMPTHAVYYDMVMLPATAHAAGISYEPSQILATTESAPTTAQRDALNSATDAIGVAAYIYYEGGPSSFATTAQWALLALCALITLGAAYVAIGLARSDGKRDEAVLGTLGAPPRIRRAFSFWSAAIITGVGSIGGVLLGTVPALAVSQSLVQPGGRAAVPFTPPWAILTLAALGLPLLLAAGAWLTAGRSRIQYNHRTPID